MGQTRKQGGSAYTIEDLYPESGAKLLGVAREQSADEMQAAWDRAIETKKRIRNGK